MDFNKQYGTWDLENATLLDNIAYQLYLNQFKEMWKFKSDVLPFCETQEHFVELYIFGRSYKQANIILRKEKIERLKNKINEHRCR
jgi:pterin-4a-carbinolamine dehydratase